MKQQYLQKYRTKSPRQFGLQAEDILNSRVNKSNKKFPKRLTHDEIEQATKDFLAKGGKIKILVAQERTLGEIMGNDNGQYVEQVVNGD